MKKKFYNVGSLLYFSGQKRGVETAALIVAGASALAGTVSSISSANSQKHAQEKTLELNERSLEQQEKLFHEGNIFNATEAEKARQFNAGQAEINRNFQSEMLDNIFQKQEDWWQSHNSMSAQYADYLKAGINPASLVGNGSSTMPTFNIPSGSAASGSAASSAGIPAANINPLQGVNYNPIGDNVQKALTAAKDIFGIKKTAAETEGLLTENQFKEELIKSGINANNATATKMYHECNKIDVDIDATRVRIDELRANIDKINNESGYVATQNDYLKMKKFYESAEYEKLLDKMEQDYHISRQLANAQLKVYASEVFKNHAGGVAAYAAAEKDKAIASIQIPAEKKQLEAYAGLLNQEAGISRTRNAIYTLYGFDEAEFHKKYNQQLFEKARYQNTTFFRLINAGKEVSSSLSSTMLGLYGAKGVIE